jgi:CRP-like cAMP-binding protein
MAAFRSAFGDIPRMAKPQTALVRANKPCRRVLLLASGWAYRQRVLPDGRHTILDLYLPGDLIGLDHLFLQRPPDSVMTLTAAGYYALECSALRALSRQHPGVGLAVGRGLFEEKQRIERHTMRLARLPTLERTAAAMCHLCERLAAGRGKAEGNGSGTAVRLPLTPQQWANYLGLSVVHLNRALRAFHFGGLLRVETGAVVVDDPRRLAGIVAGVSDLA